MRVAVLVGPVLVFLLVRRLCVGLQRVEEERVAHGFETGVIRRSVEGGYTEDARPRELVRDSSAV
jgi:ubiquinol-cytochrome c reductase cytochrome b subunit